MCSNIFSKFSFQTCNIISRRINESQICLGLWYDVQTISKKMKWEEGIIWKIGLMCKKKIAISCENGIGCQYLSQRVKGLDVYIFLQFSCYFFIQLCSLRLYFLTKPPEALPKMSQLMNSTDTILGVSSCTAELSLMGRLGSFCFGFIFKKCHNISHAMK